MRSPNKLLSALFTSLMVLPSLPAAAQMFSNNNNNPSVTQFDQFPSFVQLTSTSKDGTQTQLRCGYSVTNDSSNKKVPILDPEFHEITTLNPVQHSFTRLEHVNNVIIATYMPPQGTGLLVELVKPDGSVTTKNCLTNLNNDTIANCSAAQPMTSSAEVRDADQKIIPQCNDLLEKSKNKFNADIANPTLAASFKAAYQAKISTIETPTQQPGQPVQQPVQVQPQQQ